MMRPNKSNSFAAQVSPADAAHAPTRVIVLDSNVWRRIVDDESGSELVKVSQSCAVKIAVAPAVLYEALRSGDAGLVQKLAREMTRPEWLRLMPEAYSESLELLQEIRRLRPHWCREIPDMERFWTYFNDWSSSRGGFWQRVREHPESETRALLSLGDALSLEAARDAARLKAAAYKRRPKLEHVPLKELKWVFAEQVEGWNGEPIDLWRADALISMTEVFSVPRHAYLDWLLPHLDTKKVCEDYRSWVKFWLYDVNASALPRFWMRTGAEYLQSFRTFTQGHPVDAQISTYLLDADILATADRGLKNTADRLRADAPVKIGSAVHTGQTSESLFQALRQLP